tara:strand:+ start:485 stop:613 length:129 start_codon:yes stop_codon:yes gene_type:complete
MIIDLKNKRHIEIIREEVKRAKKIIAKYTPRASKRNKSNVRK